jgi:cobalt/nickel transport system ATP-binding protein
VDRRVDPALLLIGHGSRSAAGVDEFWAFSRLVDHEAGSEVPVGSGFIELAEPDLDTAIDKLVVDGATAIVGVPLVLLGAGHLKNDGPAALARGRERHPAVTFTYAHHLDVHPLVLEVAEARIREAVGQDPAGWAVVLVGRGSSDPDANADLYKAARLLWDARGVAMVEPAFVSLAHPSVTEALERCHRLGAERFVVVPYFLFTGVLVDRIRAQTDAWAGANPHLTVHNGTHLGADCRLARLVLERFREAAGGGARMNCDCCVYRVALPGYTERVGAGVHVHTHSHAEGGDDPGQ